MRALYCLLLICSLLPLSGCADLNISNPFETKSSDGSEVYFDQFPDVPIPRDITVEGRVDKPSLANAMILNMNRQGWNLRGAAIGSKTMHLYEKGERYAVIYYYEQTTTAAMEIWVMTRLADGVLPTMGNGGAAAGMDAGGSSSPSFYLTPDTSTGTGAAGGGVHQQGLSQ